MSPISDSPQASRPSRSGSTSSTLLDSPQTREEFLFSEDDVKYGRQPVVWYRLTALTLPIFSIQMLWSILMAHGTPYLHALGFSTAMTSLVWMSGPLASALLSPIIGQWSDNFAPRGFLGRFGRRKPFIVFGVSGIVICLAILATVKETCGIAGRVFGYDEAELEEVLGPKGGLNWMPLLMATTSVYAMHLFVTTIQVGMRSFIVDCVSPNEQKDASAWVSRWGCSAAVFTYWLGSVDLPTALPFLGDSQFRTLAIFVIVTFAITVPASLIASAGLEKQQERKEGHKVSIIGILAGLWTTFKELPETTWTVFKVQIWVWLAWFPFLYYQTAYIAHLASGPRIYNSAATPDETNAGQISQEKAVQTGSFTAFLFASTSLIFTFLLPVLSQRVRYFTVERLWLCAQVLFAASMFLTLFVGSALMGTIIFATLGFSWAMTQWAPFAIITAEISRINSERQDDAEAGWKSSGAPAKPASEAGAVLGLHNVAMGLPQTTAAIVSAALFKIFETAHVQDQVGWILRCAGLASLGAIWICRTMVK